MMITFSTFVVFISSLHSYLLLLHNLSIGVDRSYLRPTSLREVLAGMQDSGLIESLSYHCTALNNAWTAKRK